MKCSNCGTEFDGKICPNCGTEANPQPTQVQQEYTIPTPPTPTSNRREKKKKPFYKRGWFIILAIIVIAFIGRIVAVRSSMYEKIDWAKIELGSKLPTPEAKKGRIWGNTDEELRVDLNKVSEDEYKDYVSACKDLGYTVDADTTSISYEAYNEEGYKLCIRCYSDEMTIELDAPMEFDVIQWPSSTLGKLLPTPKSAMGKFSYEHDTSFLVYVGDTTQEDYNAYVAACAEKGFDVDYTKDDTYYYADNADGYHISLKYEGADIMSVSISSPNKDELEDATEITEEQDEGNQETSETTESSNGDTGLLDPDFKAAMDSYEKFMDEYIAFMKKYSANPGDLGLLVDYADYMNKYAEFLEDFKKWDDVDMNTAETAYYLEVQARVSKKLLDVAS